MSEQKDESGGFKVVDRRSFASDGSRVEQEGGGKASKNDAATVHPAATTRPSPSRQPSVVPPEPAHDEPEEFMPENPSGFETLVSYLSTTAMFQMGLLPGPGGERIPTDLHNARRTIELLEVLQEKTQGNLQENESKLLEDVLYELRITFVELQDRRPTAKK